MKKPAKKKPARKAKTKLSAAALASAKMDNLHERFVVLEENLTKAFRFIDMADKIAQTHGASIENIENTVIPKLLLVREETEAVRNEIEADRKQFKRALENFANHIV